MRISWIGVVFLLALFVAGAGAQAPAQTAAEDLASLSLAKAEVGAAVLGPPHAGAGWLDKELSLVYKEYYAQNREERSIQDEISIDLIDLDALRSAIGAEVGDRVLRLSLEECVRLGLDQNHDILIMALTAPQSDGDLMSAWGEFDPQTQVSGTYTRATQSADQQIQAFSGINAIDLWRTNIDVQIGGLVPWTGTQYGLLYSLVKEESTYSGFVEEFQGSLTMTLTQPILRGFGGKSNMVRIRAARLARQLSNTQFQLTVMTTVAEVIKSYWDLVGAIENLKVREGALENAERLLKISETRREIGTAADIEVLQSKAGVASRQSELISARSQVASASDLLKQFLDLRDGDRFSPVQVVPTDRPNIEDKSLFDPSQFEESLDKSVALALARRPEAAISELQIDNAEMEETRAKRDMMPQLDFNSSYTAGGRDHRLRKTFRGILNKQDEAYTLGLTASLPIGNHVARGQHLRAKLARREAEQQQKKTLQGLMLNAHMAVRNVMTNRILVESNRQARRLQEANVVAEEKRLRLGVTTSWQVLQVQEDLTAAQTLEVQAQTAYEKALVELQLAEGTLLENMGIEIDAPEQEKAYNAFLSYMPQLPW